MVVSARTENEGDFPESRAVSRLPSTASRDEGGEAIGVRCDVTQEDDITNMFEQTKEQYGRIDILVNNAAILVPGTIEDIQVRHWDLLYRVNIKGPFLGCKFVIPYMKEQNYGHIINISSVGAHWARRGFRTSHRVPTAQRTAPARPTWNGSHRALPASCSSTT